MHVYYIIIESKKMQLFSQLHFKIIKAGLIFKFGNYFIQKSIISF